MSATIFCELALYGPDSCELKHQAYKRQQIRIDLASGYDGKTIWRDLDGATVAGYRLLIGEHILIEEPEPAREITAGNTVEVELHIPGKGLGGGLTEAENRVLTKM